MDDKQLLSGIVSSPPSTGDEELKTKPLKLDDGEYLHTVDTSDLPKTVKLLSAAKVLMHFDSLKRHQDIDHQFWDWKEPPVCVLFVSHRWRSTIHPDPGGERFSAIRFLLKAIHDVALAYYEPLVDRVTKLPTIKKHGILQAACIVNHLIGQGHQIDGSILSRVGLWVDFCCLPQKSLDGCTERTAEEMQVFTSGLRMLPTLVASSNFILSMRREYDDYITRAWCISELCFSSFKYLRNVIVLREDLLGQDIDESLLHTMQSIDEARQAYEARQCFDAWERHEKLDTENFSLAYHYASLEVLEEIEIQEREERGQKWPVPFFTTGRVPRIFPNHATFLMNVRTLLSGDQPKNVVVVVIQVSRMLEMVCNEIGDHLVCGLHILRARMTGHTGWRTFFNECLFRWSRQQSLVLSQSCKSADSRSPTGLFNHKFEQDEKTLNQHAYATKLWLQHTALDIDPVAKSCEKLEALLNAIVRQFMILEFAYVAFPSLGVIDMGEIMTNAMGFAGIACEGSKVEIGLVNAYACWQILDESFQPDFHKLPTLVLEALDRLSNGKALSISHYKAFECRFVDEMTKELRLDTMVHYFKAENLRKNLVVAARSLEDVEL